MTEKDVSVALCLDAIQKETKTLAVLLGHFRSRRCKSTQHKLAVGVVGKE